MWKKWETHIFQNTGRPGCSNRLKRWWEARDDCEETQIEIRLGRSKSIERNPAWELEMNVLSVPRRKSVSGFLGLVLHAESAVVLKPLWLQSLFWVGGHDNDSEACLCRNRVMEKGHRVPWVSMHPPGAAKADPTCLMSRCVQRMSCVSPMTLGCRPLTLGKN